MRILCIPYTYTISHVSRPLLVAKELKNRGHEMVFAGEGSKRTFIQGEGFEVLPLYEPDPDNLFGNIRKQKLRFISDAEIEHMIQADIALYREAKPDLVLTDGRFTAALSTHIAGIKHAAIVNVSSTEYRALPYVPFFAWVPSWLIGSDSCMLKTLDSLALKIEMFAFDNVMNIFMKLSKRYGLHRTITATNCLAGKDITLLADIPEYFPARNLPDNYYYVGPLTLKSAIPLPSWWPPERNGKPLIYITMGTTGIGDFFHKAYELFKASEMIAIMTTGAQVGMMENINGQVYVETFLNGDSVIEHCDLVVCHGGNGTIYQALQHGKPVLGIPTILDQHFNMRRVEALGIGRMLSWKEFSGNPASLISLIMSMINEKAFYQRAAQFKSILQNYNAANTAADIIEASFLNINE